MIPLILSLLWLIHLAVSATVTLTESPAYQSQRPCARDCFYLGAYDGPDNLADALDCDITDIENECLCRADFQDKADRYLKSCVSSRCDKATIDVNSAVSIYDGYCTSAGFHRAPGTTPATTTGMQGSPSTVTVTAVATVTVSSAKRQPQPTTQTTPSASPVSSTMPENAGGSETSTTSNPPSSTSSGSNNSKNGLDTSSIVGIVFGVLGFFATAVGSWYSYKSIQKKNSRKTDQ